MSRLPPPPPPSALAAISPQWQILAPGTELWRIYRTGGRHPAAWNTFRAYGPRTAGRFDHHLLPAHNQARGVLYAARAITTCVAEAFQRDSIIARHQGTPYIVSFCATEPLWLLDLRGTWPTVAGASMALNSSLDRRRTQAWSRAIYESYPTAHGLWYASSMHANEPSILLYERCQALLAARPMFNLALADPALDLTLASAAREIGYILG